MADGACAQFDGDLDDYRDWLQARRRQTQERPAEAAPGPSRQEQRRVEAQARDRLSAQRRPLEQQLQGLEREIEQLGAQRQRLETHACRSQSVWRQTAGSELKACLQDQAQVNARLHEAEERWLDLQAQLEALERR